MKPHGFTLLELLIALGFVGILTSFAVVLVRPGDTEIRQAAQTSANAIVRARLEAIRVNGYSNIVWDAATERLVICTAPTLIVNCAAGSEEVKANVPVGDDYPRVVVTPSADFSLVFDRRGFSRGTSGSITFSSTGTATTRTLLVSPVGRVTVEGS